MDSSPPAAGSAKDRHGFYRLGPTGITWFRVPAGGKILPAPEVPAIFQFTHTICQKSSF
jgi:hypothetical protein